VKNVLDPKTHGRLRRREIAARGFFRLARIRTSVYIAQTQPEDATWARNAPHPQDYNDPDPPSSTIFSQAFKVDPA
jgi:hypothetical protein